MDQNGHIDFQEHSADRKSEYMPITISFLLPKIASTLGYLGTHF